MSNLSVKFSGLEPKEKAMFLTGVAHMATIAARESYVSQDPERNYDRPYEVILRDANNFIHRVTGHIMHVLASSDMGGQNVSIMRIIEDYYRERDLIDYLSKWLETP